MRPGNAERDRNDPVYLDYNATTPHDPEVIEAMRPYLERHFGNPSSGYAYGHRTKDAIMNAREQVASLLKCAPEEILFTSGGTESNNHAIRGVAWASCDRGRHIIASEIEHPAVTEVCRHLESRGFEVTYVPVDEYGLVSARDVERALRDDTILITIMHANNEVGTIQPVGEISALARPRGIVVHTDAAQSVGKIPVTPDELGADLLTIAGHKLYAPKGVGALYIRRGTGLHKLMYGAGQESGRRAGTENVMEITGLGKACEVAGRDIGGTMRHLRHTRDMLFEGLQREAGEVRFNGHPELRLPNTLSIGFGGMDAHALLAAIQNDVAASAGSACHSGCTEISAVLRAMRVPFEWAKGTVRFSTGRFTTAGEIEYAVRVIGDAVRGLRKS